MKKERTQSQANNPNPRQSEPNKPENISFWSSLSFDLTGGLFKLINKKRLQNKILAFRTDASSNHNEWLKHCTHNKRCHWEMNKDIENEMP